MRTVTTQINDAEVRISKHGITYISLKFSNDVDLVPLWGILVINENSRWSWYPLLKSLLSPIEWMIIGIEDMSLTSADAVLSASNTIAPMLIGKSVLIKIKPIMIKDKYMMTTTILEAA